MDKFQIIYPSMLLTPYVKQYWFLTMENVGYNSQRFIPFGHSALIIYRGCKIYSLSEKSYLPQSHLYSITKEYIDISFSDSINFICIVFQPTGIKAFFDIPLTDLNGSYLSLDALRDKELIELEDQLNDANENIASACLIEQFLCNRLYKNNNYNEKRMNTAVCSIYQGETNINHLAETVCIGYKQFKRVFVENIGTNPKEYLEIVRFQRVHQLLQQHIPKTLEELAEECGYYDKSHLIKNLKTFSGFTPSELENISDPIYSNYHSLFRSAFIDLK